MKCSTDYNGMIARRLAQDPEFAAASFREAVKAIWESDYHYALRTLREIIKAGMGFTALAATIGMPAQNIHRALSSRGNPTIKTLGKIVSALAVSLGVDLSA